MENWKWKVTFWVSATNNWLDWFCKERIDCLLSFHYHAQFAERWNKVLLLKGQPCGCTFLYKLMYRFKPVSLTRQVGVASFNSHYFHIIFKEPSLNKFKFDLTLTFIELGLI